MHTTIAILLASFDPSHRAWEAVDAKRHGRGPNGFASIDGLPCCDADDDAEPVTIRAAVKLTKESAIRKLRAFAAMRDSRHEIHAPKRCNASAWYAASFVASADDSAPETLRSEVA